MKNRVREIMRMKGVTIQRLSDASGVSRRTVQTIISGEVSCHMETMTKLAESLDVTLAELFLQPYERIVRLGMTTHCDTEFVETQRGYDQKKEPRSIAIKKLANAAYECFMALPEEAQREFFEICYHKDQA